MLLLPLCLLLLLLPPQGMMERKLLKRKPQIRVTSFPCCC
jgi:hypothetical protein